MKKILKIIVAVPFTYLSYCFVRGIVWGFQNPHASREEKEAFAQKVAYFKG